MKYTLSLFATLLFSGTSVQALECSYTIESTYIYLKTYFPSVVEGMADAQALGDATALDIGYKGFADKDLPALCSLAQLTRLKIYNDDHDGIVLPKLTGASLDYLSFLTALQFLDLDGNSITSADLEKLNQIPRLIELQIGIGNDLSGSLKSLDNHPSLVSLTLNAANLTISSMAWIAQSKKTWTSLSLYNNPSLSAKEIYPLLAAARIQALTIDTPIDDVAQLSAFVDNSVITWLAVPLDQLSGSAVTEAFLTIGKIPSLTTYNTASFPYEDSLLNGLNGNNHITTVALQFSTDDADVNLLVEKIKLVQSKAPNVTTVDLAVQDFQEALPIMMSAENFCKSYAQLAPPGVQFRLTQNLAVVFDCSSIN